MKQINLVPNRCMGCEECIEACGKVHDWETRAFVEVVDGYFPFPMRCQHCQDAPCKAACPEGAISRSKSGAILVDLAKCIGCGTCGVVCPFGVPYVSENTGKVVKCDQCDELVASGGEPVCVTSCPKQALQFGELEETLSEKRLDLARQVKTATLP